MNQEYVEADFRIALAIRLRISWWVNDLNAFCASLLLIKKRRIRFDSSDSLHPNGMKYSRLGEFSNFNPIHQNM